MRKKKREQRLSGNFIYLPWISALVVIFLDQLTKVIFFDSDFQIIGDFLCIKSRTNTGASFSILSGNNTFLIFIGIVIVSILVYGLVRWKITKTQKILLAMIIGGAIGNLIDRLLFGYVRDFIYTSFWPTFNLADSFISVCGIIFLIILLKKKIER